jgi:hypothetical protein
MQKSTNNLIEMTSEGTCGTNLNTDAVVNKAKSECFRNLDIKLPFETAQCTCNCRTNTGITILEAFGKMARRFRTCGVDHPTQCCRCGCPNFWLCVTEGTD